MHAMVLQQAGAPLEWQEIPKPTPDEHAALIAVEACAVCRTDLHVLDNELPDIPYPIIPGHQVIGRIVETGPRAVLPVGQRVGVAWLGSTCQNCSYCTAGRENLCDAAKFHGYQLNGGYAEYMLADSRYIFPINESLPAAELAPLLCGGLIGYRSLRMTENAHKLGIYGFGSAAHLITQLAVHQGRSVFAFTRPGDTAAQLLARECGAKWAGSAAEATPEELDAGIIFAPAGELIPKALTDIRKGGSIICGGIHMSDIPSFPYADLWGERCIRSVANMTREDGYEFLEQASAAQVKPHTESFPLHEANTVLSQLRAGLINGTAVLLPG